MLRTGLLVSLVAAGIGLAGTAHAQQKTVYMPAILELSGAGAVSRHQFPRRHADGHRRDQQGRRHPRHTRSRRRCSTPRAMPAPRAPSCRKCSTTILCRLRPGVLRLGPGDAVDDTEGRDSSKSSAARRRRSPCRDNAYIFRTSFGQQCQMPKIANYIHDGVKAKSVAVVWVNNDFGKGGRDAIIKELKERGINIAADISTEAGQADFSADVDQAQGRQCRRRLRLSQRGGERALPARGREAGHQQAADRRDHAARPEGDRARRRRCQRRQGPCRPHRRCADQGDAGVRQEVRGQRSTPCPTITA